ncbi:MAG: hypothetical protein ACYC7J_09160 [Syntrophales bacterium]
MLTGEISNQIEHICEVFWSGGISNPLEVIEQITSAQVDELVHLLDEVHARAVA